MKHIKNILKKNIKILRKIIRADSAATEKSEGLMWLTDNFHVIEKNFTSLSEELKKKKHILSADNSIELCREMCADGILPENEKIISFLRKKKASVAALDSLPLSMKFTFINIIAENIQTNEDVAVNAIKSLIILPDIDFGEILYEVSETEKLLRLDPAGVYSDMSEQTKTIYRTAICLAAEKECRDEISVTKDILEKARNENRHIGFFIDLKKPDVRTGWCILTIEAILPLIVSIVLRILTKEWYIPVLIYLPVWEALKFITDFIFSHLPASTPLARMDFSEGIPENEKTVIAVSTLLPSAGNTKELCENIKNLYLSNCRDNTCICILADLKNASVPTKESDNADIRAMKRAVDSLNNKYQDKIILAIRKRTFSETENEYTGCERKRGAIISLVKLIADGRNDFYILHGNTEKMAGAKYIMALDSDTKMPLGSLRELVSVAAHPLNSPVISKETQRVVSGYGIISPRIETDVKSACRTHFSSLMAGNGGLPSYTSFVRERYMELFSESIFSGKGLINIKAFNTLMPDRFPEQRILSHDIPEGIILRTAFAGDVTLTDSFPADENAYFKRLHRWIRGDVQNIPFLFKNADSIPTGSFPPLGRYWLSDNIRRALTPVFAAACLIISVFVHYNIGLILAFASLGSMAMPHLFSCIVTLVNGGISMFSRLYFSDAIPYALGCILKAFVSIITMITSAVTSADAVIRSLFRMVVSKKHLLEWTTAADSNTGTTLSFIKKSLPSVIVGFLLIFYGNPVAVFAGICFICDMPFSVFSARKKEFYETVLSEKEKNRLLSYCASMWRFYETHCNKKNNYLIPDNVQKTPVYCEADRTSPTNIGMMLCSFLAARDFDFIDSSELCDMLTKSFETLGKMEKFKGHLYNWYNTRTLGIMEPHFISAVDSGNFLCCIVALSSGLESYVNENPDLWKIIEQCNKIIKECDLGFLYDKRRKLFRIGYDTKKNEFTSAHFDLMMSEARMTSYFAVSSGKIPASHWQTLAIPLSECGRYTGPVSWSGTMFEYFMPAIFIPSPKNTLSYEALEFCIHCQKKRVKKMNIPYGISESAYYSFDPALNYRYKAHGVSSLAMKRNNENETVISPYSTFLTLPFDPHSAMKNLEHLKKIGMYGKFGFYEAVDFTPSRTDGHKYAIIKSYMAHHVGMSFLSAANAVFSGIMQKRFMENSFMAGGESLLGERIPSDIKIHKKDDSPAIPQRRERSPKLNEEYTEISAFSCESHAVSNGAWSVFLSSSGKSVSVFSGNCLFAKRQNPFSDPDGIFSAIRTENGKIMSFSEAIVSDKNHSAVFSESSAVFRNSDNSLAISETITLHPFAPAQIHSFSVKNKTKEKKQSELMIYCEPYLENVNDIVMHPAYSKLFIEVKKHDAEKVISITRKQNNKEKQIYIAMGFSDGSDFSLCTDREAVIPRKDGIYGIFSHNTDFSSESADKCVFIKLKLTVDAKSAVTKKLIICGASDRDESINALTSIRKKQMMTKANLSLFDKTSITGIYAKKVTERLFFGRKLPEETLSACRNNALSRKDLWKTGISGDYPVITVTADKNDLSVVSPFLKLHSGLRLSGIITELVFFTKSKDSLSKEIKNTGNNSITDMINRKGGIFILSEDDFSAEEVNLIKAAAIAVYPEKEAAAPQEKLSLIPIGQSSKIRNTENSFSDGGYLVGKTPYLPWCHIIANKNFGTLVSDSSLGYTWALNSRENKLTPWSNNTREKYQGEALYLESDGKMTDIINGSAAFFKDSFAVYFSKVNDMIIKTTVSLKGTSMCKEIKTEIVNKSSVAKNFSLYYYIQPVLCDTERNGSFIKTVIKDGIAVAHNPYNNSFDGYLCISSDEKCSFLCDKTAFLCGKEMTETADDCIIAKRKISLPAKNETVIKFYLSYSAEIKSAVQMPYINHKKANKNKIEIETPDENLNNIFNCFLQNQIIAGRIYGRTGFYQCSGAFGFRDQLQDAMAVILTHPEILRTHIFRCATAQFCEGDVLHWFHQIYTGGRRIIRGVRTKYSDDLLWLPLAVSEYCIKTGDIAVLDVQIPFIDAPVLEENEKERYGEYTLSDKKDTLYNHCIRAINHACVFGRHSLPLIKGGDWNDSFNAVGIDSKGESVWLAMFLSYVAKKFTFAALMKKDRYTADFLTKLSDRLMIATDTHAWSKDRYLRCFYDDGTPMGMENNKECSIDLLPQAWSAIIGMPDKNRVITALETAEKLLCDKEHSLIKLFSPAFTSEGKTAGYVNRYPEGVRENAGQYTHGAVWLADAYFSLGNGNKGYEMLKILNPVTKDISVYKTEPYYLAGDVYAGKNIEGRGGWSIYTGSAGWFYRTVYEKMLGITQTNGLIITTPCLPDGFERSRVRITIDSATREYIL